MRILHSHIALLVRRIALLYIVLALCRAAFWLYNLPTLGPLEMRGGVLADLLCGAFKFDTVSILYVNAPFILLSLVPLHLRERGWWQKTMFWYYTVVNSLAVVALNMADAIYFRYAQKRFTADEIFFADNGNSLQLALKFAAENWYMVLVGVLLIAFLVRGYGRRIKPEPILAGAWYYLAGIIALTAAAALTVGGIRGGFTKMTRPVTLSNATLYTADNSLATMILSNPFCVLRTAGSGGRLHYERWFDDETLRSIYTPEHRPSAEAGDTELTGRNVVIFVMESFSAEHSALLCPELYADKEQKGYTPFLDSLMRQSYTFRRMYSNGKRSIQALPAVWSSIPSFKTPFVLMPQSMGATRALPAILKDKGYETMFFCGSDRGSMGFGAYARAVGIDDLRSREDYEAVHGKDDFDGYWGIWDEEFMQYMGEVLSEARQPFFSTMFTLSSHHPFVVPERYAGRLPEGLTANHKCVAYVDGAFRRFFDRFGDEEWFRNTVFVFVADHVSSEKFSEEFRHSPDDYRIFGFIYAPESSLFGEHRTPVSQIDLMPTLLGLLGNREPYFAFGRDIFNEHADTPFAINYDNNMFQAVTESYLVRFDEHEVRGVYSVDDIKNERDLRGKVPTEDIERQMKAMIQSYYDRVENKNYTVDDSVQRDSADG